MRSTDLLAACTAPFVRPKSFAPASAIAAALFGVAACNVAPGTEQPSEGGSGGNDASSADKGGGDVDARGNDALGDADESGTAGGNGTDGTDAGCGTIAPPSA